MKKTLTLTMALLFAFPIVSHATHIVKPGDTMFKIAIQHQMELDDLIKLNPQHPNPNIIHVGDHIITRDGTKAEQIVEYARSLQDETVYVYGGQNAPLETDCSGWVQAIYRKFGEYLPRTSQAQSKIGTPVKFEDLQKGDLMFFSTRADKVITHVGIAMGNDYWISNLSTKQDVEVLSNWGSWTQRYFMWGRRIL
jgi:cell wall-associated NlpC family hydrolase